MGVNRVLYHTLCGSATACWVRAAPKKHLYTTNLCVLALYLRYSKQTATHNAFIEMTKHTFVLLLIALFVGGCRALLQPKIDADTAYANKQYTTAADLLKADYETTTDLVTRSAIANKVGECYRLANRTDIAETWYAKALEYSTDPLVNFRYAQMLKANGRYNEAINLFKEYMLNNPGDRARGAEQVQGCRQALEWLKKPSPSRIENVQGLNSAASDFSPAIFERDKIVFTSDRETATGDKRYGWTGQKFADLFIAQPQSNGMYANPALFGDSINTPYNEGTVTFSSDYRIVYFTACGSEGEKDDFCQIYTTYRPANGKWALPEKVDLFDNDTTNVGQPCLSPDGTQLYFASDAPGGFGNKDLYVVTKMTDGLWSDPENLGPEINTSGYEGFPYIGTDGKFYFASDGLLGMGGLDLFSAERRGKKWVNAQNLQAPINSAADDFGIAFEPFLKPELLDSVEAIAWFSSSRKGGKGSDDLYRAVQLIPKKPTLPVDTPALTQTPNKAPQVVYWLEGRVWQKTFNTPDDPNSGIKGSTPVPDAIVQVLGLSTESRISKRLITTDKGEFGLAIEEDTDYKLTASQAGFFTKSDNVTTRGRSAAGRDTVKIYAEITLDKIYKRKEIVLENIYYDLDKADIRDDAKPTLNKLAVLLKENPNIKIELGSHTDSRGSDSYNLKLSQARAQSALNYLVVQGIEPTRLTARGYGETQLTNRCSNNVDCSEAEHQQNRRTTFKVTGE